MFLWVKTVAKKLLNNFTNYYLAPHLLPTLVHTGQLRCLKQKKRQQKFGTSANWISRRNKSEQKLQPSYHQRSGLEAVGVVKLSLASQFWCERRICFWRQKFVRSCKCCLCEANKKGGFTVKPVVFFSCHDHLSIMWFQRISCNFHQTQTNVHLTTKSHQQKRKSSQFNPKALLKTTFSFNLWYLNSFIFIKLLTSGKPSRTPPFPQRTGEFWPVPFVWPPLLWKAHPFWPFGPLDNFLPKSGARPLKVWRVCVKINQKKHAKICFPKSLICPCILLGGTAEPC